MLDLLLIRADKGGNPDQVIESQKKRFKSTELVTKSMELDKQWKEVRQKCDTAGMNLNAVNNEIKKKKKESKGQDPCTELIAKKNEIEKEKNELSKKADELFTQLKKTYSQVGNILHESVPISNNEDDNQVIRTWGTFDKNRKIDDTPGNAHHYKVLEWLGGYDSERGVKIAGHRGYFLTGPGVMLNQALIQYGLKFLASKGYTQVQPPYFMKREIMGETAELADFDEMLYKVEGSGEKKFSIEECSSIIPSKKYFAIINKGKLTLYLTKDCSKFKEFDELNQVSAVHFCQNDKYLVIIQKFGEKNLKIFDLANNCSILQEFRSQTHPSDEWPQIKISKDDKSIYFHNKLNLEIYDENKNCINKIENVLGYEDIQFDDKHFLVASTFILKSKGKKDYNFVIYDFKDLSKPTKVINTSLTDRVKIKASLDHKYILVNTINDNTSNKSYYGQSSIYFFEVLTGKFTKFNLPEGPVHDFNWCPDGEHFIICAGHLPSTVKYYKKNGTFEKDIAKGNFNTVKISPDSRIVALCGFGSLKGDIELYSLKDFSLIGRNNFFCCVNFEWSQDSKYLLGGEIYDCIFLYEENEELIKYDEFNIEKNMKSLEEKKKESTGGVKITSTLGKIDFSNKSKNEADDDDGGIVGLGKKKKKKKKK